MTRKDLEQMLLDKIHGEYIDINVDADYYLKNTYDEEVVLAKLTIQRIYEDGVIIAYDHECKIADEFAIYELTADSIINLLNNKQLWGEK